MNIAPKVLIISLFTLINFNVSAQYQWPFPNSNIQGKVTGSVGEYRYTSRSATHRFHQGVDLVNGNEHAIHSINAGLVSWNRVTSASGSIITVTSSNGRNIEYIHIDPKPEIKNNTLTQVAIGDYLGEMIVETGWPTHLHLQEQTTNFLHNNLSPYVDTSPPYFGTTSLSHSVAFYRNGLLKTTIAPADLLLDQQIQLNGNQHTMIYNKIDIAVHAKDAQVNSDGSNGGGQIVPSEISWNVKDYKNTTITNDQLRFDGIPSNEAVLPSFHPLSAHPGSPSIHIVTSHPRATPYDRFWNTKLKKGQVETWNIAANRPATLDARVNLEAAYPDGAYTLNFNASDVDYDNDPNLTAVEHVERVIIDNFRPYIKEVTIKRNGPLGILVYSAYYEWNAATSQLKFIPYTGDPMGPYDNLWIKIVASEPIQNLKYNEPTTDGSEYWQSDGPVPNTNSTEYIITHGPVPTKGTRTINFYAEDFAGNQLQTTPTQIPVRQADGTWLPVPAAGIDSNHKFNVGVGDNCSWGGGRVAQSAGTTTTTAGCLYADVSIDNATAEINEIVKFTPTTSGNGLLTYEWNFGSGAIPATSTTSGQQNVLYTTAGVKTVTLKICDNLSHCITKTKTGIVAVGQPPVNNTLTVDFSTNRYGGNINDDIQLTSIVTGAVGTITYSWDFGDAVTKGYFSDVNPLIAYSAKGYKTITLTVTDANGSVTKTRNNYLLITSPYSTIGVTITGCGPISGSGAASFGCLVNGGGGGPYSSYKWDFGDGRTSTSGSSVTHTYKNSGIYTVGLTVCDQTGCSTAISTNCVSVPTTLNDNASLKPNFLINDFQVGSPTRVSLNTPVKFISITTGGGGDPNNFIYSWDFESHYINSDDLESAIPAKDYRRGIKAQEVYYTTAGIKEVSLTVDNGSTTERITMPDPLEGITTGLEVVKGLGSGTCYATIGDITLSSRCWSSSNKPKFTVPVIDNNCPIAKTEVMLDGYVLPGGVIDFKNFPTGYTPTFPFEGDFTFTIYQSDGISLNRIGYRRQKFTIYGPVVSDAGVDKQVCLGSSAEIGSAPVDERSYKWSSTAAPVNLLNNLTIANPVFNALQKGIFVYRVTVTNKLSGCSSYDDVSITVDNPEVSSNSFFVPLAVSAPLSVPTTGGFGNNTFQWSPAIKLGSNNVVNPLFNSTVEGDFSYTVTVTDQQGCFQSGEVYVNASSSPGNLQAKAEPFFRISLTWIDRSPNETGFVIQKSIGDESNFTDYVTVGANTTYFEDLNIEKGTQYFYRVTAIIAGSRTAYSTASVNTGSLPLFSSTSLPYNDLANALADIDNDGDLDIVTGGYNNVKFYKNESGVFSLFYNLPISNSSGGYWTFKVSDLDNDGRLDLFRSPISCWGSASDVILNQGTSFTRFILGNFLGGVICVQLVTFDINNDNNANVFMRTSTSDLSGSVVYSINSAGSTVISSVDIPIPSSCSYAPCGSFSDLVGIGDMDNNGSQDIITLAQKPYIVRSYPSYRNTFSAGRFTDILPYTDDIVNGALDIGDIDMNGTLDMILIMRNAFNMFLNDGKIFNRVSGLNTTLLRTGRTQTQLGDFDMDGDLDFFISCASNDDPYNSGPNYIFINENGTFNQIFNKNDYVFDKWIDYDGDGDLDILGLKGSIYINNLGLNKFVKNQPPSPPSNLCVFFNGTKATFSWDRSTDSKTADLGLTYNLYVKQNGVFILSPLSDLVTGFRKIQKRGNVDQNTSWTLDIPGSSNIEWGVQAVDNSYAGSTFAKNVAAPIVTLCGQVTTSITVDGRDIKTPLNCATTAVSNGGTLSLDGANDIRLLPGFSVQLGSFLNARLTNYTPDNSPCVFVANERETSLASKDIDNGKNNVSIYPNPNNGQFNIVANLLEVNDKVNIEVLGLSGIVIKSKHYYDVKFVDDVIDISATTQGVYVVRVTLTNGKTVVRKMVKL